MKLLTKIWAIIYMGRPFLWIFSIGTALCGAIIALKGVPPFAIFLAMVLGIGPCTTTAINVLNGVFDIETDRINKPDRPLIQGKLSKNEAIFASAFLYTVSLVAAFFFGFWPFTFMSLGVILSIAYSVPPIRLKNLGLASNIALAVGYSGITFIGGWSLFKSPFEITPEALTILFLIVTQVTGANVVKDFVDYEGDLNIEIRTIPVRFGIKKSVFIILPLMVGVYLTIPVIVFLGVFKLHYLFLSAFSLWGIFILKKLYTANPSKRLRKKMFVHAFFMSLLTEIAFAAAYLL